MAEFTRVGTVPIVCKVIVHTQPCGYVAQGDTAKAKITDLFRHQQQHVRQANGET
jgi:hypothetical protein